MLGPTRTEGATRARQRGETNASASPLLDCGCHGSRSSRACGRQVLSSQQPMSAGLEGFAGDPPVESGFAFPCDSFGAPLPGFGAGVDGGAAVSAGRGAAGDEGAEFDGDPAAALDSPWPRNASQPTPAKVPAKSNPPNARAMTRPTLEGGLNSRSATKLR